MVSNTQKTLWFVEHNINFCYSNLYDYPSEINLISSLAIDQINFLNINIKDVKINSELLLIFNPDIYTNQEKNIFIFDNYLNIDLNTANNNSNKDLMFNYVDWGALFENLTFSYLNTTQSYLSSHHIGRKIAIDIKNILDKKLNFII